MSDIDVLEHALHNFIRAVENTGGAIMNSDGFLAPLASPESTDIGRAYAAACEVFGKPPLMCNDDSDDGDINAYGDRDV